MAKPELSIEIDRVIETDGHEVTAGDQVVARQDKLPEIAKGLSRQAVEELIGEDAEGVVLRITRTQRVKIT